MNAKVSVFVICVEAIVCLLLYNLHDCTFNFEHVITGWVRVKFSFVSKDKRN